MNNNANTIDFENITEEYVNKIEEKREDASFEEILENMKEKDN